MFIFSNVQFRLEMNHSETTNTKSGGDFPTFIGSWSGLCSVIWCWGAAGRIRLGSSQNKCSQLYGISLIYWKKYQDVSRQLAPKEALLSIRPSLVVVVFSYLPNCNPWCLPMFHSSCLLTQEVSLGASPMLPFNSAWEAHMRLQNTADNPTNPRWRTNGKFDYLPKCVCYLIT